MGNLNFEKVRHLNEISIQVQLHKKSYLILDIWKRRKNSRFPLTSKYI